MAAECRRLSEQQAAERAAEAQKKGGGGGGMVCYPKCKCFGSCARLGQDSCGCDSVSSTEQLLTNVPRSAGAKQQLA